MRGEASRSQEGPPTDRGASTTGSTVRAVHRDNGIADQRIYLLRGPALGGRIREGENPQLRFGRFTSRRYAAAYPSRSRSEVADSQRAGSNPRQTQSRTTTVREVEQAAVILLTRLRRRAKGPTTWS